MRKKYIFLLLAILLIFAMVPSIAFASEIASGECGENVTWTITSDGTLTVSGEGAMTDWEHKHNLEQRTYPWKDYIPQIKRIVIEEGITHIGNSSFYFLDKLESADIASTVKTIGDNAFHCCVNLKTVNIYGSLERIGHYAFAETRTLTEFNCTDEMPGLVIGGHAFYMTGLKKIVIPKGTVSLGTQAFGQTKAEEIIWHDPVDKKGIGSYNEGIFKDNETLKKFIVPDGQVVLHFYAFVGCNELEELWIPYSVTSLSNALQNCTSLTDIYYGGSEEDWKNVYKGPHDSTTLSKVTMHYNSGNNKYVYRFVSLEDGFKRSMTTDGVLTITGTGDLPQYRDLSQFDNVMPASSVKKIIISGGITSLGYAALTSYGNNVEEIVFPDSLYMIGERAFSSLSSMTFFNLPDDVSYIAFDAFNGCESLIFLDIPNKMQSLESRLLSSCKNLKALVIPERMKTINDEIFSWVYTFKDIYYEGTPEQWEKLSIGNQFETFNNATIHYNFKGNVITFFGNGGTGEPENITAQDGETITLPETIPTNGTLKFVGWSVYKNAKTAQYKPGDTITVNDHMVLSAIWLSPDDCEGHVFGEKEIYDPASCWKSGYYRENCIHCGFERTGVEPMWEHDLGEWTEKIPATETQNGVEYRQCQKCWYTEERVVIIVRLGDVNGDNKINALDATQILRYANNKPSVIAGVEKGSALYNAADVNRDGKINALDATQILRFANNKPSVIKD